MSYLKLAYLAEFAVAFNLAFGEWKHEKIAEILKNKFDSLDNNCEGPLADIINDIDDKTLQGKKSKLLGRQPRTWMGRCVNMLDKLRLHRSGKSKDGCRYKPLWQFFERALLFATPPQTIQKDDRWWRVLLSVASNFPFGLLASWAYPKTPTWKYPPCPSSLVTWPLVVILSIAITLATTGSGTLALGPGTAITLPFFPHIFAFFGATAALLSPRPISAVTGRIMRRYPPTPRGRYYPLVMVGLVTLVLIAITFLDNKAVMTETAVDTGEIFWMFLFGFLSVATLLPIALFAGYLALETSIEHWTEWAEKRAKDMADKGINSLPQPGQPTGT